MAGDQCFVVMSYGRNKPIIDEGGLKREFNFDKIYDVIIKPAIEEVGLIPKIAREEKGSGIIHAEMFRDLRDCRYVVVDLSLFTPNVLYELGIRHVMAGSGTVLICRRTTIELPFDIKLSRVIFYDYDGVSIDWQEAERVRPLVVDALKEAMGGRADSPVHAFLERVLPVPEPAMALASAGLSAASRADEPLEPFQRLVGTTWLGSGQPLADLLKLHGGSVFGASALGYACLEPANAAGQLPPEAEGIAVALFWVEKYTLANQIFVRLNAAGTLGFQGQMLYGSSISEEDPTIDGATRALAYATAVLTTLPGHADPAAIPVAALEAIAHCRFEFTALLVWKYQLTSSREDLQVAIAELKATAPYLEQCVALVPDFAIGRAARSALRLMLLLRDTGNPTDRFEANNIADKITGIRPNPRTRPRDVSYLEWYQAITLADAGLEGQALFLAASRLAKDRDIMRLPDSSGVGRRQYRLLRRFIENNMKLFNNQKAVAQISQMLQSAMLGD